MATLSPPAAFLSMKSRLSGAPHSPSPTPNSLSSPSLPLISSHSPLPIIASWSAGTLTRISRRALLPPPHRLLLRPLLLLLLHLLPPLALSIALVAISHRVSRTTPFHSPFSLCFYPFPAAPPLSPFPFFPYPSLILPLCLPSFLYTFLPFCLPSFLHLLFPTFFPTLCRSVHAAPKASHSAPSNEIGIELRMFSDNGIVNVSVSGRGNQFSGSAELSVAEAQWGTFTWGALKRRLGSHWPKLQDGG